MIYHRKLSALGQALILMSGSTLSLLLLVFPTTTAMPSHQTAFLHHGTKRGNSLQRPMQSRFMGTTMKFISPPSSSSRRKNGATSGARKGTDLGMFLGNDGGILGVGAPEIAVTLLVGYFVLGPSELYKLTKEIGKFIQNFRTLGTEASKSFENTMENQLELDELRKAQNELNSAFGFRRSINVDQTGEAFSEIPPSTAQAAAGAAAATAAAASAEDGAGETKKKRRKRRRVKKKQPAPVEEEFPPMSGSGEIPDLDMSAAFRDEINSEIQKGLTPTPAPSAKAAGVEDAAGTTATNNDTSAPDWFSASEQDIAKEVMGQQPATAVDNNRFASQLNGDWNQQILDKEEELSPLANIMDRIAILEEERNAANLRLEEEFAMRAEIETKYYNEKKELLEQAAAEVSMAAFGGGDSGYDDSVKEEQKKVVDDKKSTESKEKAN